MVYSEILEKIIIRLAEGDQTAFKQFYDLFFRKVYNFTKYYIKDEDICDEIVSDVFISIWLNRDKLVNVERLDVYVYTLARNKSLNHLDKISRQPSFVKNYPLEISFEANNPEKILITSELESEIHNAISELPEKCKQVFLLSREKGLRYKDIANMLSISEKTVNAQMVIAIKKITSHLKRFLILF